MKVFISHSYNEHHKIAEVLERIQEVVHELKDAEVWDPGANLAAGDNFRETIRKEIISADLYILLWTQGAAESPWVLYEAGMADASGKRILIATEPDAPPLIDSFRKYQAVQLKSKS